LGGGTTAARADTPDGDQRNIGLLGATGVGVGAIVGGGILALSGVAFASTGPGAILAFALNGGIAFLTALSFAELAAAFPRSGGTYAYAKRALSVEAAFGVGWVVWFASIVAAVLYAKGLGAFLGVVLATGLPLLGITSPELLTGRVGGTGLALVATVLYALGLTRSAKGGGNIANVVKVGVFAVLIVGGLLALLRADPQVVLQRLRPVFPNGALGLVQAMGYTFIALQGFDLVAAVAGQVRDPERNLPRAMLGSLGLALLIYLPLLFVVATVGVDDRGVSALAAENPETLVAEASRRFLGQAGYWLVLLAGVFSFASALQSNLFAASRVAQAMALDRALPHPISLESSRWGTPIPAIFLTTFLVLVTLVILPDVAAAGAASSLIFLVTFALAHGIAILARRRRRTPPPFRVPFFPAVPVTGGVLCGVLALFQGVAVPEAGVIAVSWLVAGLLLFLAVFGARARIADASDEARDPETLRLRGRSPLVLVPIANPASAPGLVSVAHALAPKDIGRVLLLVVAVRKEGWNPEEGESALAGTLDVVRKALAASLAAGHRPSALTTVAPQPWEEIARVARTHRCAAILLGLSDLVEGAAAAPLEDLTSRVDCDVVVLRAPHGFDLDRVDRVLVPVGGKGFHGSLRARLLGSLFRTAPREATFLRVVPMSRPEQELPRIRRELAKEARDEGLPGRARAVVERSDSVLETVARHADEHDLIVLGMQILKGRKRVFGDFALGIARRTSCPMLLISRRG